MAAMKNLFCELCELEDAMLDELDSLEEAIEYSDSAYYSAIC